MKPPSISPSSYFAAPSPTKTTYSPSKTSSSLTATQHSPLQLTFCARGCTGTNASAAFAPNAR